MRDGLLHHTEPAGPFFSICVFTHNRAHLLGDALASALAQTYPHFEVVVVDDGSTDDTEAVVRGLLSPKLRYLRNPENLGRPDARNRAIEAAQGDFIVWLADDDRLAPNALALYAAFIQTFPETDIFYCNLRAEDADTGEKITEHLPIDYAGRASHLIGNLISANGLTDGGSCIRKTLYAEIGGYDPRFTRAQDYQFWFRAARSAQFRKVPEFLYTCRVHRHNVSNYQRLPDQSFESLAIREALTQHALPELFPHLDWEQTEEARNRACIQIAAGLIRFRDYFNAVRFLQQVSHIVFYPEAFKLLLRCHLAMNWDTPLELTLSTAGVAPPALHPLVLTQTHEQYAAYHWLTNHLRTQSPDRLDRPTLRKLQALSGDSFQVSRTLAQTLEARHKPHWAHQHYVKAVALNPVDETVAAGAQRTALTPEAQAAWQARRDRLLATWNPQPLYYLEHLL